MPKINNTIDKYICYCEKKTYNEFFLNLEQESSNDFNILCKEMGVAQKCAACLPNLENAFFSKRSATQKVNPRFDGIRRSKVPFYKKVMNFMDFVSGTTFTTQKGILPILYSKKIETWLVVSNSVPRILEINQVSFRIECEIFDDKGNKIKTLKRLLKPHEIFKICLSRFMPNIEEPINVAVARIKRYSIHDGFRGSTRPHFFYRTRGSMAALHVQDGGRSDLSFAVNYGNTLEKRWIFINNVENKIANYFWKLYQNVDGKIINFKEGEFSLPSFGSYLLSVPYHEKSSGKIEISLNSNNKFKSYLIISSSGADSISVDHI